MRGRVRFPQITPIRCQVSRGLRAERPGLTWHQMRQICGNLTRPLLVVALRPVLLACPVCFQVEQNSTTRGVQAAVLVLIAVTVVVLIGFGMFIVRFVRRS